MAIDSQGISTCVGCFLVSGVRGRPTRAPHQVQALLGMRDTQRVLAHGGFAEAPPVEARGENSQKVEAVPQTRVEEAVLRTSETSPSGAADTQMTPDKPVDQATSSRAIGSIGGKHAK